MSRAEPHGVGSILHVIQRGTRGTSIVRDAADRRHFKDALFYLNDEFKNENWKRDIVALDEYERPAKWPDREPLVDILAWTLLTNHFHLVLQERTERGIARFMQRLCNSMTRTYNEKYAEQGSLFQGSYMGKVVRNDTYLRQLISYVLVKNVLEVRPGGLQRALREFDKAWDWATAYRYSSFGASLNSIGSPVLGRGSEVVSHICQTKTFKAESRSLVEAHRFTSDELREIALEDW